MSAFDPGPGTLQQAFAAYAAAMPEQALEYWDREGAVHCYNPQQIVDAVYRAGEQIVRAGGARGARVLLALGRADLFFVAFWACQVVGAVAVPAKSPERGREHRQSFSSLEQLLEASDADLLVISDPDFAGAACSVTTVVLTCTVFDCASPAKRPAALTRGADPALIQFTSGSTSAPKGCVLSHSAVLENALAVMDRGQGRPGDCNVTWVPLHHDMGLMGAVLLPVVGQGKSVIIDTGRFMFQPLSWIAALADRGRVHSSASNFALSMVTKRMRRLKLGPAALADVQNLICGAEMIDPVLVRSFLDAAAPFGLRPEVFHAGYGLAEVTVMATSRPGGLHVQVLPDSAKDASEAGGEFVCVGTPVRGAQIEIRDAAGMPVGTGQRGEIAIRTPSLMDGYFRNHQATQARIRDGWLCTGDIGALIGGELYVTGRASEMMVVAGQNVFPQDVEPAIAASLDIDPHRVCVFSVPSAATEKIITIVEARGQEFDPGHLQRARSECLARLGIAPATWIVSSQSIIPRTSSGKPRRLHLRTQFMDGSLDRGASPVLTLDLA